MKKFLILMTITALLLSIFTQSVFAVEFKYTLTDESLLINKTEGNSSAVKSVAIKEIDGVKYLPLRALAEAFDGIVEWDNATRSIKITHQSNQLLIKSNSNEVFINGDKIIYDYPVTIIEGTSYAPINIYKLFTNEYLEHVEVVEVVDKADTFTIINGINCDKLFFEGEFEIKQSYLLENPNRLVIDLDNYNFEITNESGMTFTSIRTSKNDDGSTRLVFDLNNVYQYTIFQENDGVVFVISKDGTFNDELIPFDIKGNKVIMNVKDYSGYNVSRLSDPFSIVVDIPTHIIDGQYELTSDNQYISKVLAFPYGEGTRFVIQTIAQCRFELEKNSNNLTVGIFAPTVNGVDYYNFGDRKYIEVEGIDLANSKDATVKYFTQSLSSDELTYKMVFNDKNNNISSGQIYVNDDYINSIFVDKSGTKVTITIEAKEKFKYYTNAETRGSNINILPIISEEFVVIDPGHGGFDPGAVNGDIYESHLNLQIALKLEEMLNEQGIKTFMMRETDEFVGVYERADIANVLQADLFVSIHINALNEADFSGIMTLAYPGSVNYDYPNGQLLAREVQKEIILSTEGKDLGIIDRDKLVVLRDTSMPSVLVECGFITNQEELNHLIDANYQHEIASGIKQGILNYLEYVR